jgi:glycosyltransferase involved in cell wall biosynthesis
MPSVLLAHPSPDRYGSDLQMVRAVRGLVDAGWRAEVFLPADGALVSTLEDIPSVKVRVARFTVLRKALAKPTGLLSLLLSVPFDLVRTIRRIRRSGADVVYVNTVTIPIWIIAARLCRRPVLVHVREAEADRPRLLQLALNAPMLWATRVVTNSKASRQVLTTSVPPLAARTSVLYNGIPDPGPAPAVTPSGRVALVGRLSPRKGIDVALEAIAILRRGGQEVHLDICGTPYAGYEWYEEQLRTRADQPDLRGAVHFHGYVHPTWPVLSSAQIVVVPSRTEPFGNVAVEGMLAQRPVIASDVQGLAEIISSGETGWLVPADDEHALASAISKVLDNPELASGVARAARTSALERFSMERYVHEVNAELSRLL